MLTAGVLIWMNTRATMPYRCCIYAYGWPLTAIERTLTSGKADTWSHELFYSNIGIDVALAVGIFVSVVLFCEWRARRKAGSGLKQKR